MNAETAENYSWRNKANTIQIKGDSLTPKITKSNFLQQTQEQFLKLTTSTIGPILWKERVTLSQIANLVLLPLIFFFSFNSNQGNFGLKKSGFSW